MAAAPVKEGTAARKVDFGVGTKTAGAENVVAHDGGDPRVDVE